MKNQKGNVREVKFYQIICDPYQGSPGAQPSRGSKTITLKAWSSRNAIALACQELDIHPKNYVFATNEIECAFKSKNKLEEFKKITGEYLGGE